MKMDKKLENDPTKWKAMIELPPQGWECPRCGSVNAPKMDQCKCNKNEDTTKDTRKLLLD